MKHEEVNYMYQKREIAPLKMRSRKEAAPPSAFREYLFHKNIHLILCTFYLINLFPKII